MENNVLEVRPVRDCTNNTKVLFQDELFPVLRLKLSTRAAEIESSKLKLKATESVFTKLQAKAADIFQPGSEVNLSTGTSAEELERNDKEIDEAFAKMQKKIEETKEYVKKEMRNLPPDQQREVVNFWATASEFFADILLWLSHMFQTVLEKIRQGWKLVNETLSSVFRDVKEFIARIFG